MSEDSAMIALCADWVHYKQAENTARNFRLDVEEAFLAYGVSVKDDGATTTRIGNYKVTTKAGYTYKIDDVDQVERICEGYGVQPPLKVVYSVDNKTLKDIAVNHPQAYTALGRSITAKPAKVSFTIVQEAPKEEQPLPQVAPF